MSPVRSDHIVFPVSVPFRDTVSSIRTKGGDERIDWRPFTTAR
jgi:hypothetical protein